MLGVQASACSWLMKRRKLVQCRTCGFFAKQAGIAPTGLGDKPYYEIPRRERDTRIDLSSIRDTSFGLIPRLLACFKHAYDLNTEAEATNAEAVARADRECPWWYQYSSGMSPREHLEELRMYKLEERRKENDLKLFQMNQAIQNDSLKIAEASKNLVSDLKDIATKSDRSSRRIAVAVIILAAAQVIVGIIALYRTSYTDQLLEKLFGPLH